MILPVAVYGHPVLKKQAKHIDKDYPLLNELIDNMFETMYNAEGVGLAAPQINKSIRLFIIDATPLEKHFEEAKDFIKVFINAQIEERTGNTVSHDEGCLSIPGIREEVKREDEIIISYYDKNWVKHKEKYKGYIARVIQHEYDHIEGILFTDKILPLRKVLLKSKLRNISSGKINPGYKIIIPPVKQK
ncbi:MAG: peptide deformylase [Bacteroidales bacterium]